MLLSSNRVFAPSPKLAFVTRALPARSRDLHRTIVSMAASSYKYVVLGGGNAAGYAAREFVERGVKEGELAIISSEPYVPYERPALSKAYLFPDSPARLPGFHTCVGGGGDKQLPDWYKEKGIEFKLNTEVTGADVKAKELTTGSGDKISYEKLIIATGSGVMDLAKDFKIPGADMEGFYYLRNVVDADKLVAAIADLKKSGGKAVVIGGGYIGMEIAAGLAKNDVPATVVFPEPYLLSRLFTPEIAQFYEAFYETKGVTFIKEDTAVAFEGKDGKVTTTKLKSGKTLESDLVVVGVGARANTDLFKGQLDLLEEKPGGIKTDGKLQTSDPNVYAVGDIAAFPLPRYGGKMMRQEHVQNARESAKHAVTAILAPEEVSDYNYLPYFYSRVFNLGWVFYGQSEGEPVMFGDKGAGKFGAYWVKDGKVVGAFLESGSPEETAALKKLADVVPDAPSTEDLKAQGLDFASKL